MAKIKSLLTGFYADRPGFFLACTRFFFMFLFWIAFYLAAFTARGIGDPNIFNVADFAGVGSAFVLIWWILILLFVAFSLLKNAKTVKIVAIVQLAFIVVYLGMILITYSLVLEEVAGNPDVTVGLSFGFWLMLILLGLLVISVFFTQLIEKVIAKLVPPQLLHPAIAEPVVVAPAAPLSVEPQPVAPPPVEPAPIEPTPVEPMPVEPMPIEPDPVPEKPAEPLPVEPEPVSATPVEPEPVEPKPES